MPSLASLRAELCAATGATVKPKEAGERTHPLGEHLRNAANNSTSVGMGKSTSLASLRSQLVAYACTDAPQAVGNVVSKARSKADTTASDCCKESAAKKAWCSIGSCNSKVSTWPSTTSSKNPSGRPSKSSATAALGKVACRDAMSFQCPRKPHSMRCEGIHMSAAERARDVFGAEQLELDIKKLRNALAGSAKAVGNKSQAVADYMMSMTPTKTSRIPVPEMPWRVGCRRVCAYCWCAATGFLMENRGSSNVSRFKESFEIAKRAYYCEPTGGATAAMCNRFGEAECNAAAYPDVVHVPRKHNAVQIGICKGPARLLRRKEHAECWLNAFCNPEEGNVQHRTDNTQDHVQGYCAEDLWQKYRISHPRCNGGAGRSTFYTAIIAAKKDGLCDIKFDKWSAQAECAECLALKIMKGRAKTAEHKEYYQQELDLHNFIARADRLAYGCNCSLAETKPLGKHLWSFAQDAISTHTTSGPACHAKPLRDLKGAGSGLASAEQLSFKTTGCIVHGYGYFLYALEPHLPANANSNIYVLHKTIMHMFDRLA